MEHLNPSQLIAELLLILGSGLLAGVCCRKWGISLLVGYLVVGALVGSGGLNLVPVKTHELELLAEMGALLLLFAVGLEFSAHELSRMAHFLVRGGSIQMTLVAVPLALAARCFGFSWPAAILSGGAGALSSTVLVFRSLSELGESSTPHGRRALGILVFQDVALVPLLLAAPLLSKDGQGPSVVEVLELCWKTLLFVGGVWSTQHVLRDYLVPLVHRLRSLEVITLFAVCILGGVCWAAHELGLPAAVGALAAGLILSGNRLSHQIDSILLPFRETFAAIFFVTLGMLLQPAIFLKEPVLLLSGLIGVILIKSLAAAIALRTIGLPWKASIGMGLGLSQLGEFSFLLISEQLAQNMIAAEDYNRMLFIGLGTLILTPVLTHRGLKWCVASPVDHSSQSEVDTVGEGDAALVVGVGLIGRQVASRLETLGLTVSLIDLSPINLQSFSQLGFRTVAGDARDRKVLEQAQLARCVLVVILVPADDIAMEVLQAVRKQKPHVPVLVRCRFEASIANLERAGAAAVISEEAVASEPLLKLCEQQLRKDRAVESTVVSPG